MLPPRAATAQCATVYLVPVMRAVNFDFDGLMFNTEDLYWQVGTELMRRRGHEYTNELNDEVMGQAPRACFEMMIRWYSLDERWEELMVESEEIFLELLEEGLEPMPGLFELLDALEAVGIPKAICTSSTRAVLSAVLARFHMEHRFLFTLTSEDISQGKPDPEIYRTAADRFGLEPRAIVVLEDSQVGCRAAAAAGSFVVAVPGRYSRSQDFSVASLVVESLADQRLYDLLGLGTGPEGTAR